MIRTGYIRHHISVVEQACAQDRSSREIVFTSRPVYRKMAVLFSLLDDVRQRFAQGNGTYAEVLRAGDVEKQKVVLTIDDVGPYVHRYDKLDRERMPSYWITKVERAADAFAHEVVRRACDYPELLIANPLLRANYASMVKIEAMKVITGASQPEPTDEITIPEIDVSQSVQGIPELVAAELVRDVMTSEHFAEFCAHNHVTVKNGEWTFVIPRLTHGLVNAVNRITKEKMSLCIVFKEVGLPPSDEVVMKYLLARHDPGKLFEVGNRFAYRGNIPNENQYDERENDQVE